jgi:hypothetical protein
MKATYWFRMVPILAVLLVGAEAASAQFTVSVFDNDTYVDSSSGGASAESDNVQASLISLGHTVNTYTGITAADFTAAIDASDCLLFPEFEHGLLGAALSASAKTVLSDYVSGGGGLIVNGGSAFIPQSTPEFLNAVFGFSLANSIHTTANNTLNVATAVGTEFEGGPASLPGFSATHALTSGVPVGTKNIYESLVGASVSIIPFGSGAIIHLGWDWFGAAPLGANNGGWLEVLDSAVRTCADAECFLVLGTGPTGGTYSGIGHTWSTQVSNIISSYAVLLDDIPSFPFPVEQPTGKIRKAPGPVGEFYAQIVMWNPVVFPSNAEQWSKGLHVTLWSNGTATAERYGTRNGMGIRMEVYTDNGQKFVRFPFSIVGF